MTQPTFSSYKTFTTLLTPHDISYNMSEPGLLRKDQLELSLHQEKKLIQDGILKEDNPLDVSENFHTLCMACRKGDLKVCQEMITEGVNINSKDSFDYTPLILVSLGLNPVITAAFPASPGQRGKSVTGLPGESLWTV